MINNKHNMLKVTYSFDTKEFVLTGLATCQDLQGKDSSGRVWRAPGTPFEVLSPQGLAHCRELAASSRDQMKQHVCNAIDSAQESPLETSSSIITRGQSYRQSVPLKPAPYYQMPYSPKERTCSL